MKPIFVNARAEALESYRSLCQRTATYIRDSDGSDGALSAIRVWCALRDGERRFLLQRGIPVADLDAIESEVNRGR